MRLYRFTRWAILLSSIPLAACGFSDGGTHGAGGAGADGEGGSAGTTTAGGSAGGSVEPGTGGGDVLPGTGGNTGGGSGGQGGSPSTQPLTGGTTGTSSGGQGGTKGTELNPTLPPDPEGKYDPSHPDLQFVGRIDFANRLEPVLVYPGSYVKTAFEGTSLSVSLSEQTTVGGWIGFIVDGKAPVVYSLKTQNKIEVVNVARNLANEVHSLVIVKRSDPNVGAVKFLGIKLDPGMNLRNPGPRPSRKIECFGDSVTAGTSVEGMVGMPDPKTKSADNGYLSWCSILARNVSAEANVNAIAGEALYKPWAAGFLNLPERFDRMRPYNWWRDSYWNFSLFQPQVVIIASGQNDFYTTDNFASVAHQTGFKDAFKAFIPRLREKYPGAEIILMTTAMWHTKILETLTSEVVSEYVAANPSEKKLHFFAPSNAGTVSPDHPRTIHQERMAKDVAQFINGLPLVW